MININYKHRLYRLKKEILVYILERLSNEKVDINDDNKIRELVKKYNLDDEYFLKQAKNL